MKSPRPRLQKLPRAARAITPYPSTAIARRRFSLVHFTPPSGVASSPILPRLHIQDS
jgi:hypothetical protein